MITMSRYMDEVAIDVRKWAEARCTQSGSGRSGDLYSDYRAWPQASKRIAPSIKAFGLALTALGFDRRKSGGQNLYIGLAIRSVDLPSSSPCALRA